MLFFLIKQKPPYEEPPPPPPPRVPEPFRDRDSAYESRRASQFTGMTFDNFRLISVLGRGHFGKVSRKSTADKNKKMSDVLMDLNDPWMFLGFAIGDSGTVQKYWGIFCPESTQKGGHHFT